MHAAGESIDAATHPVTERHDDGDKDQEPPACAQTVWSFQNAIVWHRRGGHGLRSIVHKGRRLKNREGRGKADDPPPQIVTYDEVNVTFRSLSLRLRIGHVNEARPR